MPIYDYYCVHCAKVYEIIIKLADIDEKVKCPYCKKELKKRISPPKVIRIN